MKGRGKVYATRREKVIDFSIGFFGWFILNALLGLGFSLASSGFLELTRVIESSGPNQLFDSLGGVVGLALMCIPMLVNIGLLVFFAFRRAWIAIGGASAFAATLFLTICAGIVWTVACFVILSDPNGLGF